MPEAPIVLHSQENTTSITLSLTRIYTDEFYYIECINCPNDHASKTAFPVRTHHQNFTIAGLASYASYNLKIYLVTEVTKIVERNVTILYHVQTLPGGGKLIRNNSFDLFLLARKHPTKKLYKISVCSWVHVLENRTCSCETLTKLSWKIISVLMVFLSPGKFACVLEISLKSSLGKKNRFIFYKK